MDELQETQQQEPQEQESQLYRNMVNLDDVLNQTAAPEPTTEPPATEAAPETPPATPQEPTQTQEPVNEPTAQVEPPLPTIEYAPAPQQELKPEDIVQKFEDKEALLKALGLDEYAIGALKYYQQTGDMTPYLEAKSVDYNKLPDAEVLKRSLREEVASMNLTEEEFDTLYSSRVLKRYKQDAPDEYSESEVKMGQLEMKLDAHKARQQFTERQAKFAPPPQQPRQEEPQQVSMDEIVAANTQRVLADPVVQQFTKSPVIKIGDGPDSFNYQSKNPNALLSVITDGRQTAYYTSRKDEAGRIMVDADNNPIPNYQLMMKVAAYMTDPDNFERYLINHGKSLGTKQIAEQINPIPEQSGIVPPAAEPDFYGALAAAMKEKSF